MKKLFTSILAAASVAACGAGKSSTVKLVTDGGDVSDKSFNETIWNGVKKYAGNSSSNWIKPNSTNKQDLKTIYAKVLKDKTEIIVMGGFQHSDALKEYAPEAPEGKGFIYIDGEVSGDNINSIQFKTQEAAFYAGYLTAQHLSENKEKYDTDESRGLKVGTYGGMDFSTVTAFMGGFQQGVAFWNSKVSGNQNTIEFIKLGSTAASYFSGGFKPGQGKAISEKLINAGADVILPVAGPQTLDTLTAIAEKKAPTLVVGVDTDQAAQYEKYSDKFLTSILKNMDKAGYEAIRAIKGEEKNDLYGYGKTSWGTIKNGLIGLAFDGKNKIKKADYDKAVENSEINAAAVAATDKFEA